tara:strand:- start:209 stop:802 length:594 start_codon:yes stop_codon:yes gene_type:complete
MLQPKVTFNYIFKHKSKESVFTFFVLAGIAKSVDRLLEKELVDRPFDIVQLVISIILGGALGWISYYVIAWFLEVTGGLLKGKARLFEYRRVLAWSLVPVIVSLFILIPQFFLFGAGSNNLVWENGFSMNSIGLIFFIVLSLLLDLWTLIILIIGVAYIQNFSIGRAVLNIVLPILIVGGTILGFLALIALINDNVI